MSCEKRQRFRRSLEAKGFLCVAGVHDGISARVADGFDFDALFMTGNGVSASALGLPDLGLSTATEMARAAGMIAASCKTPLIADADTGYGGVINIRRTVATYEAAGVCALQIEDQVFPKRCGQGFAREVVSPQEMAEKVAAACTARRDRNLAIIGRTDAMDSEGLAGALERARLYALAGADILFIEGLHDEADYRSACALLERPVLAIIVNGKDENTEAQRLANWGVKIVVYPSISMLATAKACYNAYAALKTDGSTAAVEGEFMRFKDFTELMGASAWLSGETKDATPLFDLK